MNRSQHSSSSQSQSQRNRSRQKYKNAENTHKRVGRPIKPSKDQRGSSNQKSNNQKYIKQTQISNQNIIILMEFFNNINEPKGFVFNENQRKILIKRCPQKGNQLIQWRNSHSWNRQVEIQKIKNICEYHGISTQIPMLIEIILNSCCICADQFTSQFYDLMVRVYKITKYKPESTQIQEKQYFQFFSKEQKQSNLDNNKQNCFKQRVQKQTLQTLIQKIQQNDNNDFFFLSLKFKENINKLVNTQTSRLSRSQAYTNFVQNLYKSLKQLQ